MTAEFVRLEVADGVGTIRLDRPKAMNAISIQVQDELRLAAAEAPDDETAARIIAASLVPESGTSGQEIRQALPE